MMKIMPKTIKTAIIAGTLGLTALGTTTSCSNNKSSKSPVQDSLPRDVIELKASSLDLSKPNHAIIKDNGVAYYKNLDGDTFKVNAINNTHDAIACCKAINKLSTEDKPDIEDPSLLYTEILKNLALNSFFDMQQFPALMEINVLKGLIDVFSAPDSDGGRSITVKEYTQMMDAFTTFGVKRKI